MAVKITDECISCAACEPECPSNAISEGDDIFIVNPELCTECEGLEEQQCIAVCPSECIIFDR